MSVTTPFLAQWVSATQAGAELLRQQAAMMAAFNAEALRFWTGAWMMQASPRAAAAQPAQATKPAKAIEPAATEALHRLAATNAPEPGVAVPPALAAGPSTPEVEVPLPAAALTATVEPKSQPAAAPAKTPKATKPAVQLRATVARRKAAAEKPSGRGKRSVHH